MKLELSPNFLYARIIGQRNWYYLYPQLKGKEAEALIDFDENGSPDQPKFGLAALVPRKRTLIGKIRKALRKQRNKEKRVRERRRVEPRSPPNPKVVQTIQILRFSTQRPHASAPTVAESGQWRTLRRWGSQDPFYKRKIKANLPATTPLTATADGAWKVKPLKWVIHVRWPYVDSGGVKKFTEVRQYRVSGYPAWNVVPPSHANASSSAAAINQARVRLFKDIKETYQQMSGPTFMGELRETVRMLKDPMKQLRQSTSWYLSRVRQEQIALQRKYPKRYHGVRRHEGYRKMLADTWLEYSFGVLPLLSDVKGAAETLARHLEGVDKRRERVKGYGEDRVIEIRPPGFNPIAGELRSWQTINFGSLSQVKYTCGLESTLKGPPLGSVQRLVELSGFSLSEFVPTIWELMPWSFMVDYFSNVGDVLSARMTDVSSVRWVNSTQISEVSVDTTIRFDGFMDALTASAFVASDTPPGQFTTTNRSVTRSNAIITSIYPVLQLDLPKTNTQFCNIAALVLGGQRIQKSFL